MENQTPTPAPEPVINQSPVVPPPVIPKFDFISKLKSNKKLLMIIGVVFAIFILLTILMSVISKNVKNIITKPVSSPSPSPEVVVTDPDNQSTPSGQLSGQREKLEDLKKQIDDLDIGQSRLKPPTVNYKINFDTKK